VKRVFRIRRKDTGQFFAGLAYPWIDSGHPVWNDKGAFYRDISVVIAWLRVLSCDWSSIKEPANKITCVTAKKLIKYIDHTFDEKMLVLYEVVVNDITINGEEVIKACDFTKEATHAGA